MSSGSEGNSDQSLELGLSLGFGDNARSFEPFCGGQFLNFGDEGSSSSAAGDGASGSLGKLQFLVGGSSRVLERETDDELDLRIKRAKASTDLRVGSFGSMEIPDSSQISSWSEINFQASVIKEDNIDASAHFSQEVGDDNGGTYAKVEEYEGRMDLTDDLLHMVFSFLDQTHLCRAALVCKQWQVASTHEDFWRCLDFENKHIAPAQFESMCRRYPNASELNILGTPSVHLLAMNAVSSLRNLEVLTVGKGPLKECFFQALTDCVALRSLIIHDTIIANGVQEISLFHDQLRYVQVTKCRVLRIAFRCPQLKTLSLKRSNMGHAALNCPLLRDLDLGSCHKLSDHAIRLAVTTCPLLEVLDISNCSSVGDDTLRDIAESCSNLRTLDASYCPNISFESVRFSMLAVLKLDSCEGINSASMSAIANSHMLEVLDIKNCSLLTTIALELSRLTTLKLLYCRKFVDLNLRCLNLSSITVSNCAAMQRISIMSNSLQKLVLQKQESLSTLVLQCPSLQEVDLSDCESLTDSVCKVFSDGGGCPVLKSLILDDCENLKSVELSSSSLVTPVAEPGRNIRRGSKV